MGRRARITYRPLTAWPHPPQAQSVSRFDSPWSTTVDELLREADHLDARVVVVEVDVPEQAIRKDGGLRADVRAASDRVRVSMTTRHGPLSWHCSRYQTAGGGGLGWRENVRAIVKTLEALRAVDRYGVVTGAEQYRGFIAIESGPAPAFTTADEALRWVQERAGHAYGGSRPREAYRAAVRRLHPDVGGSRADWDLLEKARGLMEKSGLL